MSDVDRAELRRLLAESARPGEVFQVAYGHHYDYAVHDRAGWTVAECAGEHWVRLIAAAANALPGLLDALEKAEAHRDSLAATLIEVQREKLALERVRALHTCEARWGNEDYSIDADEYAARKAENDEGWDLDTLARFDVCAECYRIERSIEQRDDGVAVLEGLWPCPTIQALDGVMGDE